MRALLGASLDPAPESLGRWVELAGGFGPGASDAVGVAADARCAWIEGRVHDARALAERWRTLASTEWDRCGLEALDLWLAWASGAPPAVARAEALEASARKANMAGWVVDAAMVAAQWCCDQGDMEGALDRARRAARMARTESMPHWEFLAALTLARVRRHARQPFLARVIMDQVGQWLPPLYRRWASWERTLAAGSVLGDVDWDACWGEHAPHRSDLSALRGLCDPTAEPETDYARGLSHDPPRGLFAHAGIDGAGVWVPPEAPARRLARGALDGLLSDTVHDLRELTHRRSAMVVAALSLHGALMPTELLFAQVYGFGFRAGRHAGTFRVLLHRTRAAIEGAATIEREGDALRIQWSGPAVFFDPRTSIQEDVQFLELMASQPGLTAREAADRLGLPLRTAQDGLRRLSKEGICGSRREGRAVVYALEDTTYRDPTGVLSAASTRAK